MLLKRSWNVELRALSRVRFPAERCTRGRSFSSSRTPPVTSQYRPVPVSRQREFSTVFDEDDMSDDDLLVLAALPAPRPKARARPRGGVLLLDGAAAAWRTFENRGSGARPRGGVGPFERELPASTATSAGAVSGPERCRGRASSRLRDRVRPAPADGAWLSVALKRATGRRAARRSGSRSPAAGELGSSSGTRSASARRRRAFLPPRSARRLRARRCPAALRRPRRPTWGGRGRLAELSEPAPLHLESRAVKAWAVRLNPGIAAERHPC